MDFGQIVTAALQTSPDRLVALAVMRSLPAGSPMRRSTENEPLGAFVVALVLATDLPLRRSRTLHFAPLRFWSTSNARSAPDPLAGLSQREREVLGLLVEGLPNKLIARRLEISEKTVKSHLTRVFRELGVTDRTQAALWAERHGF